MSHRDNVVPISSLRFNEVVSAWHLVTTILCGSGVWAVLLWGLIGITSVNPKPNADMLLIVTTILAVAMLFLSVIFALLFIASMQRK